MSLLRIMKPNCTLKALLLKSLKQGGVLFFYLIRCHTSVFLLLSVTKTVLMPILFWIKRFFVVLFGAFVVITIAQSLKGNSWSYATSEGLIWAFISSALFTIARFFQARRGEHCAICKDTPEMQQEKATDA